MPDSFSKPNAVGDRRKDAYREDAYSGQYRSGKLPSRSYSLMDRPTTQTGANSGVKKRPAKKNRRPLLPQNFFLKRLNALYWKRLLRYLYIRFLRMEGSPEAIARGVAAGMFAGAFPLLGFQTLIGIAIAVLVRGNKMMAAAGTWISNPFTYLPLFALNFHIGCWLLRLPTVDVLPTSPADPREWMNLGMSVTAALMVGSFVVGIIASILGYYGGLIVARRIRTARAARAARRL
ncbi:DUF2062 domain-containing protein [Leptolyngbya sp. BC1307]|uniref:DUF2062 domain-containing protein n=1 Tax=Leptolyngbya sp. BC1307 TaxID=2029589 RepID=UPI000EFB5478|nr:DUF2062 domain-containing protein [Leptolyngbya sp. BC1307]